MSTNGKTSKSTMNSARYRPQPAIAWPERRWPDQVIEAPPTWCSVDLRDGNQALVEPMGLDRKRRFFEALVEIGFKQIEVGYPSASQLEWDFVRDLIEGKRIPEDVTIQVLTPARPSLIDRTLQSLDGVRRAIVHLYNSTSTLQRRVVFGMDRAGVRDLAVSGAMRIRKLAEAMPETEITLEYSPESFTGTEMDFALEICEAVAEVWGPCPERPMIVNLPATVEMTTPNIFADQIEWFGAHFSQRDQITLSVHPHNDRGTAVAAAELAVMAGADRVEGTLFGNGERTGNVDLVTLALNLHTQGVDPGLDMSDIDRIVAVAEHCNRLPVHPRHPYAGELVFTAFSGSHQDAIKKGLAALGDDVTDNVWEVPYLPIDPADVGRDYEAVIRVNAQSGKGGIAYLMERDHGLVMPRFVQVDFARRVQVVADRNGEEVTSRALWQIFEDEYLPADEHVRVLELDSHSEGGGGAAACRIGAWLAIDGQKVRVEGQGSGPIDAFVSALARAGVEVSVADYYEQALGQGADAGALAFVAVAQGGAARPRSGPGLSVGVGRASDIVLASLQAVTRAASREIRDCDHAALAG